VRSLRPLIEDRKPEDFVFTGVQGRAVRHADFLRRVWQPAIAAANATEDDQGNGIPADRRIAKRPRIHDLRHSYASWMLAQGMSLTELQYAMGHESIQTTSDRYGHLLPGHRERAASYAEIAMSQALPELED
jgi:integrase